MRSIVEPFSAGALVEEEPLVEQVRQAIDRSGYGQLRRIRVTATPSGRVRLEGRVSSFYLKQVAQTAALSVPGVERVDNHLHVFVECSVSSS